MVEFFADQRAIEDHLDTLRKERDLFRQLQDLLLRAKSSDYDQVTMYNNMIDKCNDIIAAINGLESAFERFIEGMIKTEDFIEEVIQYDKYKITNIFNS